MASPVSNERESEKQPLESVGDEDVAGACGKLRVRALANFFPLDKDEIVLEEGESKIGLHDGLCPTRLTSLSPLVRSLRVSTP